MPKKLSVHGNLYEVDDSIQGADYEATLDELEAHSKQKNVGRFLTALAKAEGAEYDTVVGYKHKVTDFSRHPQIIGLVTKEGPSTAAGRYQITATTFKEFAPKAGVADFSPESQDKVALKIIEQEGALADIQEGRFRQAVEKLGGRWASLPSSKYSQPTRTMEWFEKQLGIAPSKAPEAGSPQATVAEAPVAGPAPYGKVPEKIDPAKLKDNADWVRASKQLWNLRNRANFTGTDEEAADAGKSFMGYFNSNMVAMGRYASDLIANGTQEDKEAFLFLMETYDNTEWSWEGAGRAALGMVTDPTNIPGALTLGIGTAGKVMASTAAKQGLKSALLTSLGRTGIIAGVEGAIVGGVDNSVRQGIAVSAGRQEDVSLLGVAGGAATGAAFGVAVGTAGDAAITGIGRIVKSLRKAPASPVAPSNQATPAVGSQTAPSAPLEAPILTSPGPGIAPGPGIVAAEVLPGPGTAPGPGLAPGPKLAFPVILTEADLAEAVARQQKGRLWVDDLTPNVGPEGSAKIDVPKLSGKLVDAEGKPVGDSPAGLRATAINQQELLVAARQVTDQLRSLDDNALHATIEQLRRTVSLEDAPVVLKGIQVLKDEMVVERAKLAKELTEGKPTAARSIDLLRKLDELDTRSAPVIYGDDATGSLAGSLLRQRQTQSIPVPEAFNVQSLMSMGYSRLQAEAEYARVAQGLRQTAEAKALSGDFEQRIQRALHAGDTEEALRLAIEKRIEIDKLVEREMPGSAGIMTKLTEAAISNVFSVTTLQINIVPAALKTAVLPLVRAIVSDPLSAVTRRQMVAHYSALVSSMKGAAKAAWASAKYEQAILTRDGNKALEGEMANTGRFGGLLRTIPRLLNASDEFLGQINYAGYISGRAAAQATTEGIAKGLKGKPLDEAVSKAIDGAMARAFEQASGDAILQPLLNKAHNLGLRGEKALLWVRKEALASGKSLMHGSDEAGLNFVKDTLYKRQFSAQGGASSLARTVETGLNRHPWIKLASGQLFFRTPIRVFEEGIRLTPGLQLIAPGYLKDLRGLNGVERQVRAQGEALASVAITSAVVALYAKGSIRGDGAYSDYKQAKTSGDGPGAGLYTVKNDDGSTWVYRNFDPLATPMKIIVNTLERLDKLAIRQAQGEDISMDTWEGAVSHLTVGATAIASALRDANLAGGVDGLMDLYEILADPEAEQSAGLKLFGDKLALLVPNTFTKIAKMNDPEMKDPAAFWQVVEQRLAGIPGSSRLDESKTSKSYDALGQVRRIADTGVLHNIASTASVTEQAKGMSEDAQFVMDEMDRLQQQTGAIFTAVKPKHRTTGDLDLRTVMTTDGKETLYDRWMTKLRAMEPETLIRPLIESPLSEGTFADKGDKAASVQKLIRNLSDGAFAELMAEEQPLMDKMHSVITGKSEAKSGQRDWLLRDK
jgi:muramidase (phage lysozyme)